MMPGETRVDPLFKDQRRDLATVSNQNVGYDFTLELIVLPFQCQGLYTDTPVQIGMYTKFECRSADGDTEQFFLYCSEDGWDLSNSLGKCEVERNYEFDLTMADGHVTCDHISESLESLLGESIPMSCSLGDTTDGHTVTLVTMHESDISGLWDDMD